MDEPVATRKWRVPARIETQRLVLRCYVPADVAAMDQVIPANRAHLETFLPWAREEPVSTEQRTALVERFRADFSAGTDFTLGIFDRASGDYIGGTGLHLRDHPDHLEIGYWIAEHAQGNGLVTEAAGALTRVALQFAFSPFVAICCDPANVRSRSVPVRLGYELMGMRELEGAVHECWQLTPATFLDSPASAEPRPQLFDANDSPLAWVV